MQESPKRPSGSDAPDAKHIKASDEGVDAPSDASATRSDEADHLPDGFVGAVSGRRVESTNCTITGDDNDYSGNHNKYIGNNLRVTGNNNIVIGNNCKISGDFNEHTGTGNIDTGNGNTHVSGNGTVRHIPDLRITGNAHVNMNPQRGLSGQFDGPPGPRAPGTRNSAELTYLHAEETNIRVKTINARGRSTITLTYPGCAESGIEDVFVYDDATIVVKYPGASPIRIRIGKDIPVSE
jgi:hypothetical protein